MNPTVTFAFTPPEVAMIVALPRLVELVMVTVAMPLVVVAVGAERLPAVVEKLTEVPSGTLLPLVSFTVAVIRVPLTPSATTFSDPAFTSTEPIEVAMRVIVTVEKVPFVASARTTSSPAAVEAV